jgi:hypothetical protein
MHIAALKPGDRQIAKRFGQIRCQDDRPFVMRYRTSDIACSMNYRSEVVVGLGVIRIFGDRFLVPVARCFKVAGGLQR